MNKTQRFGAGGGAGAKFKMDRIQLFVTGDFISIDLRGCQMPTPRPRPHIPVLYREGGFTPPELYDAIEAADAWMYSRNIGVLSRCVASPGTGAGRGMRSFDQETASISELRDIAAEEEAFTQRALHSCAARAGDE